MLKQEIYYLINQPVYEIICLEKDYPIAKKINKSGFYIGCHSYMSNEVDFVIEAFKSYLKNNNDTQIQPWIDDEELQQLKRVVSSPL